MSLQCWGRGPQTVVVVLAVALELVCPRSRTRPVALHLRRLPRLLARHGLTFGDIALWEIHEAFAAQVLANIKAAADPAYRRERAKVDADLGDFPWDRVNPHGGTLALGHPFAATGARILSQAAKELAAMEPGSRAVVSVCADGGQGTVALLERV